MPKLAVADAFVDQARSAVSEEELFEYLSTCCHVVGIRYFALAHHIDFGSEKVPAVRLHNYPSAWERWFDENGLGRTDPIHRASQLACGGFPWSAVRNMSRLTSNDESVFAQARIVGIGDGYTVPAHVPGEFTASVSFAMIPGEPFTRELHSVAEMIGRVAFDAARRIAGIREKPRAERSLTDRQRACAVLSAGGKTDGEAGTILGITKGTVIQHLKNARERYDVHNKTQLSVQGLYDGLIAFSELRLRR